MKKYICIVGAVTALAMAAVQLLAAGGADYGRGPETDPVAGAALIAADIIISNGVVAQAAADATSKANAASNSVVSMYRAADTVISNGVVAQAAADATSKANAASNGVMSAFAAADIVISNGVVAQAAADATSKANSASNGVMSAFAAADIVISNGVVAQAAADATSKANAASNGAVAQAAAAITASIQAGVATSGQVIVFSPLYAAAPALTCTAVGPSTHVFRATVPHGTNATINANAEGADQCFWTAVPRTQ
jgi:hypothetical protein